MEQYNMLYLQRSPGLSVIPTSSYRNLLKEEIGLMHINFGDFYSDINPDKMSERISESLINGDYFKVTLPQIEQPVIIQNQGLEELKDSFYLINLSENKKPTGTKTYLPLEELTEDRFHLINLYENKKIIGTKIYLPLLHERKELYFSESAYSRFADNLVESIALKNSDLKGSLQERIERLNEADKILEKMYKIFADANPHLRPN